MREPCLMRTVLMLVLLLGLSLPLSAEKLYPRSSAHHAPGFQDFETRMKLALQERDADYFRALTKGAKLSFGGAENLDALFNLKTDEFWNLMSHMLNLGGVWEPDTKTVSFPYVTQVFPDGYDAFTHAAITGTGVNVRQQPSTKSKILDNLSYEIVKVADDIGDWTEVTTPSGAKGYVHQDYVYRAIGHRVGFSQHNGEWKIDYIVSGD